MMRSLYSGVSGLQIHQVKMDVIGNNIANVNTVGFKASKVSFEEVFSQTMRGAGSPQGGRGGTNPQQVGLGAGIGAITVQHTKGSTQRTNNPTDIMIDGNGFFVVSADENLQNKFYTRAGNFTLDKSGFLVNSSGFKVLNSLGQPIVIDKSQTKSATPTTTAEFKGNLNFKYDASKVAKDGSIYVTTLDVHDSVGTVSSINARFGVATKTNPGVTPALSYRSVQLDADGANTIGDLLGTATPPNPLYAEFDKSGKFSRLVTSIDVTKGTASVDYTGGELIIKKAGVADVKITINDAMFTKMTHDSQPTSLKVLSLNGNSPGALSSFAISPTGQIVGSFTNGEKKTLATIGLAVFDNDAGLMKVGGNLFTDTPNSGVPRFGEPGAGSFGLLAPGALEMSNVDLSQEFTEMITTQRGFQANSRVITTTDEMIQELVNLKR